MRSSGSWNVVPNSVRNVVLLGEAEPLSYDEVQHTIGRLLRGVSTETISIPTIFAPLAKVGAWALDHIPGKEGFVKPWMIDRANDHYALDLTRARSLLGWEPTRTLRATLPKMVAAMQADPRGWYQDNDLTFPSKLQQAGRTPTTIDTSVHEPFPEPPPADQEDAPVGTNAA